MKKIYSLLLLTGLFLFGVQSVKADEVTWTVAGTPAALFGNEWSPSTAANDMTSSDGVTYSISYSDVQLEDDVQFKVVKNHNWDEAYPSSNYIIAISQSGIYDVTITFNSSTKAVEGVATFKQSVTPTVSTWTVAGSSAELFGNTWDETDTDNDMTSTDNTTFTWSKKGVELTNGTVYFKVVKNHSWGTSYPASNKELSIPSDGVYNVTISFNHESHDVTATADKLSVSLAAPSYATIGETITLTPSATNFDGEVSYEYWVKVDDGDWTSLNDVNTYLIDNHAYSFKVDALQAGTTKKVTSSEVNVALYEYYVAGNNTTLLSGDAWAVNDANKMTYDNGVYKFEKANVALSGEVKYKVVRRGSGDDWFPAEEQVLALAEDAELYDVLITVNPADMTTVSGTATPYPIVTSLVADKTHAMVGDNVTLTATAKYFTAAKYSYSYSTGGDYTPIVENSDDATCVFEVPASGHYTFKVVATQDTNNSTKTTNTVVKAASRWTVVGAIGGQEASNVDDALFGKSWKTDYTDNDMVLVNGVFTWTKTIYVASNTAMAFKVIQDQDFAVAQYPLSENYTSTLIPGYNKVTISFDWNDETIGFAKPVTPKVEVVGTFTDNWTSSVEMVDDNGLLVANINNMPAGIQEFKLRINDVLKSDKSAGTMVRGASSNWNIDFEANNTKLKADVAGKYTFTFNPSGYLLSVSFPESFTRPASANYGSLCVPFDAELENAYAYQITSQSANTVTITKLNTNLVAGHSYIIKAIDANEDITISKVSEGNVASIPVDDEYHFGVLGASETLTEANADAYVLTNNQLCPIGEGGSATIASTKAYFKLPAAAGAPSFRIVEAENNTTGVENIEANGEAVKFFENGQLFILRNGVVYDATGRAVR